MKRRDPTAEELELWRRAMRNTIPLPGREEAPPPDGPSAPPPSSSATPSSDGSAHSVRPSRPSVPASRPSRPTSARGGLDAATQRRLRRGRVEIQARVDLHGMRQSEAQAILTRFLAESQAAGRRCVLVITGKGGRPPENVDAPFMRRPEDGVLRRQLPLWLGQEPNRSRVFAIERAHARHGGSGAYYVFLRKAKRRGA